MLLSIILILGISLLTIYLFNYFPLRAEVKETISFLIAIVGLVVAVLQAIGMIKL
jgi:hypothetical protein